jgi:hypothetical protein
MRGVGAVSMLLIAVVAFGALYLFVSYARSPTAFSRPDSLVLAAVGAPLLITFASTQLAYSSGHYPGVSPIAEVGLGVGVLAGLVLFSAMGFHSWLVRLGATAVYLVLSVGASFVMGYLTACGNGDCL